MVGLREDMLRSWTPGMYYEGDQMKGVEATDCYEAGAVGLALSSPICPRIQSFDNDIQSLLGVNAATHEITLCYKEEEKTTSVSMLVSYNQLNSSVAAQARCSGILSLPAAQQDRGDCTSAEVAWMQKWSKTSTTKSITACSKPKGNVLVERSCQKAMTQDTSVSATSCIGGPTLGTITCPSTEFLRTLMTTNAVLAQSLNGDALL